MLIDRPHMLDCTLRDGGYYTDWRFDDSLVCDYLETCDTLDLDAIEIGYVKLGPSGSGPYGGLPNGVPDPVRRKLALTRTPLAVMLDAKDVLAAQMGRQTAQEVLQRTRSVPGNVVMVRIAVHYAQMQSICELAIRLCEAGLRTCINLMQIDTAPERSIADCLDMLQDMHGLTAVYLADSLGSMSPERVTALVGVFCERLSQPIGFHAHDNQGLALHNSLTARFAGATWIDGTMLGMGRGAGNAKTEHLVPLLRERCNTDSLNCLLASHFMPLLEKYRWGASVFYGIAGACKIHPTYVQHLEHRDAVEALRKIEILRFLNGVAATSYSPEIMDKALRSVA